MAIIGGGVAGTYLAMQLGKVRSNVCLFEKDSKLGGRCSDIPTNPYTNTTKCIAIGARRILKGQKSEEIAHELNITLEMGGNEEEIIFARGEYHLKSRGGSAFAHLYPNLPVDRDSKLDATVQLYETLLKLDERKKILEQEIEKADAQIQF